jgi:hypothetical protein
LELAKFSPSEAARIALCHEISKLFDFENISLEKLSHKLLLDRDKHLFHAAVRDNGKVKTIGHNMNLFIQIF